MGSAASISFTDRYRLLSQRLSNLRGGGIVAFACLLLIAQQIQLSLDYPRLLLIGGEWLALHVFVILSQRKWQTTTLTLSLQLIADIVILAALLAFSGGVSNPFFALLLLPLLLTAGILPLMAQYTLLVTILSAATLLILMPATSYNTIPQLPNELYRWLFWLDGSLVRETPFNPIDSLAKIGLWLNLVLMASLVSFFLAQLHQRLQTLQQALSNADIHAREQQHLLTLGLNAASTAHELATPLATISLLASEAKDAYRYHEQAEAEQALSHIQNLVKRCKEQVDISLRYGLMEAAENPSITIEQFTQRLLAHFQALRPMAKVELRWEGNIVHSLMSDNPKLTQTLTTLLNNACDASDNHCQLIVSDSEDRLRFCVVNIGQFTDIQLNTFPSPQLSEKDSGHGLGLSLAHAQITQLGGQLSIANLNKQQASVCIRLFKPV